MKMIDDVIIIGMDSGYGNIKTANCCFPASVSAYDKEPVFKENLLVYESLQIKSQAPNGTCCKEIWQKVGRKKCSTNKPPQSAGLKREKRK